MHWPDGVVTCPISKPPVSGEAAREDGGTLDGEVEVNETYIGGKARKMNTGRRKKMLEGSTSATRGRARWRFLGC